MKTDSTKELVIYGNGAMAKVLYYYARRSMNVCGFTVDETCIPEGSKTYCDLPLVPFSQVHETFPPGQFLMIVAVGFIEMNELRMRKHREAKQKGYAFATYVHDSVIVHDNVDIEENCIVLDHVSIHPGCKVGPGTFISSNVNIGHDCVLAPANWINSGVAIAGDCNLGTGCFFGVNSSTAHGITLGARTFVAANTLVNKNTRDDEVYLSAPGELLRLSSKAFLKFSRMLDE